jgi:cationic antimicrobial peptide transport system ATP-binding protein
VFLESKAPVGSSAKMILGYVINARAADADEPTGALDSKNTRDLLTRFEKINKIYDVTIIMVTHDPLAASFSNRTLGS